MSNGRLRDAKYNFETNSFTYTCPSDKNTYIGDPSPKTPWIETNPDKTVWDLVPKDVSSRKPPIPPGESKVFCKGCIHEPTNRVSTCRCPITGVVLTPAGDTFIQTVDCPGIELPPPPKLPVKLLMKVNLLGQAINVKGDKLEDNLELICKNWFHRIGLVGEVDANSKLVTALITNLLKENGLGFFEELEMFSRRKD